MPDRPGTVLAVSVAMALAFAGAATAQEDGVFLDPDSPAGKEYAIPLDTARRDAQGGGGSPAGGGDAPALFGAGITARGSAQAEGGGSGNGGSGGETSSGERGEGGGSAAGAAEASQAVAKAVAQSSGGLSAGWLTILIAGGVLLVGIAVGLSVRALRGPNQAH